MSLLYTIQEIHSPDLPWSQTWTIPILQFEIPCTLLCVWLRWGRYRIRFLAVRGGGKTCKRGKCG